MTKAEEILNLWASMDAEGRGYVVGYVLSMLRRMEKNGSLPKHAHAGLQDLLNYCRNKTGKEAD